MNALDVTAPQVRASYASALLSLFSSSSTLICCALPALLVSLGAGAALSGLISAVPQLVVLSEYKALVFGFAFVILLGNGVWQWRKRGDPCPIGLSAERAAQCDSVRQVSWRIYWVSVALFLVGAWFAFVMPWLQEL